MYSLVSSGLVICRPFSVIVSYSSSLLFLALFLACHVIFGSILVFLMRWLILFSVSIASCFSMMVLVVFWDAI